MFIFNLYINSMYFWVRFFYWLSNFIERKTWGYSWCKTCYGRAIYPSSGLWVQPDGWQICPDCNGDRWYHCSLTWKSQYPGDCYCYLNNGKSKERQLQISTNCKTNITVIKCMKCNRRSVAKKEWLAILKWNNYHYPFAIKFLKEKVYNEIK